MDINELYRELNPLAFYCGRDLQTGSPFYTAHYSGLRFEQLTRAEFIKRVKAYPRTDLYIGYTLVRSNGAYVGPNH